MKPIALVVLLILLAGCASRHHDSDINNAYRAYARDSCEQVYLHLSSAERRARYRANQRQPEVSLLRGLCLERQGLYLDAAHTYTYMQQYYPQSEYSYRAAARLETLRQLGHYRAASN